MQNQSDARFLIGAKMEASADLFTFTFQRDLFGKNDYALQVPRQLLQKLGRDGFLEYVADYYLEQQPAEASRIDRSTILFALTYGL